MIKQDGVTATPVAVTVRAETLESWAETVGEERTLELLQGWAIAHQVQSAIKDAYAARLDGEARPASKAKAEALIAKVVAGEELVVFDYLPKPRAKDERKWTEILGDAITKAGGMQSVAGNLVLAKAREGWTASDKEEFKAYLLEQQAKAQAAVAAMMEA